MGAWKDKKRGDWRYSFKHEKKVYAGGGFKTKAEAISAREDRRKQIVQAPPKEKTDTTFSSIAGTYLDWSEKRHAKKTFEYKRTVFQNFLAHQGDIDVRVLNPHILHQYLNTRPSTHNYNVHRKELCALFSFAIKHLQVMDKSPCWNLAKLPEAPKRKQIPSFEEVQRILAAAHPDDKPLLIILLHTLARIDEILRLTWQDVNFERRTVTLWTRKKKDGSWKPRHVPMNNDLYKVLFPMWNRRKQEQWVFFNKKEDTRYNRRPKLMRSICKRANVPFYGFHTLRHFSATYLHDILKVPTGVIGGILGHESKHTTEIYLHSVDSAAIAAMNSLEGMFDNQNMLAPCLHFGQKMTGKWGNLQNQKTAKPHGA